MDYGFVAGDTDKTIYVRLRDSTTGLAKTGLAFNSAGAVCSYVLPLAARAAITLATQTITGAHSDGGFVEVDATNCKGLYRLDLPDAAIASGAFSLISIEFDGIIEETVLIPLHTRKVNVTQWLGTAPLALSSQQVQAVVPSTQKVDVDTIKTNPVVNGGTLTFPSDATVASTTNITAGTITTVTNLTNAPTAGDLTATMKTSVNAEVDAAIETYHLDHLLAATYDPDAKPGAADALLNELIESDAGVSRFTANALEQAPTGGSAPTVEQIADAVWDEDATDHQTAGTFGQTIGDSTTGVSLYTAVSVLRNALVYTSGSVNDAAATTTSFVTDLASASDLAYHHLMITFTTGSLLGLGAWPIADYDGTTKVITIDGTLPSAPANGVQFQIINLHVHPKNSIADAILDRSASSHTTNSTLGAIINDLEDGGRTDLLIDATLADTNELQGDWADGGRLDLIVDAILADTGTDGVIVNAAGLQTDAVEEIRNAITGGAYALDTDANGAVRIVDGTGARELNTSSGFIAGIAGTINTLDALDTAQDVEHDATQAAITALNNLSAAAVNAEVVDALATDTYAEPGQGAPAATATLAAKLNYLYKWTRNKRDNDGTQNSYYADDGSTIDQKQTTTSSGGTVTVGEMATGA